MALSWGDLGVNESCKCLACLVNHYDGVLIIQIVLLL